MVFKGSRYEGAGTDQALGPRGEMVAVVRFPRPVCPPLRGFHPRGAGQRLDLIANRYLADATAWWRLCDANNAVVPDALAARELIGIPAPGG
jgi:hypothetical protein